MRNSNTPASSLVTKMEVVCPNDTNPMGILQGGKLVQWRDLPAAISAQNHTGCICVTASIDSVSFKTPAKNGDSVTIQSKVTHAFASSVEIHIIAWKKNIDLKKNVVMNEDFFTFVAIDKHGRPHGIPELKPATKEEKKAYTDAGKRRFERIKK